MKMQTIMDCGGKQNTTPLLQPKAGQRLKVGTLLVLGYCCLALSVSAQTTAFTYQGVLTENGTPANGVYDFEFTLKDAAVLGNTVVAPVTANDVSVTNGQFTVTLDYGSGVFGSNVRWLAIGVRPGASAGAYTNLLPRQAITSAPYAIYSAGAAAAGLTGTVPSAALAGTYSGALNLNNGANSFSGSGAGLVGLNASQLNSGTVASARVSGTYGNALTLTNAANSFSGSGANLTALNASQLATGVVPDARLSANVALLNGDQTFTGFKTFSNELAANAGLRLNNSNLWLRGGFDLNHGLGWYGNGRPFAGVSNVIDGPVLFGFGGGALGTKRFGTENLALFWDFLGNIGIGTATPVEKLEVVGTVKATSFSGALAASQITGTISSNNIAAGSIATVMLADGAVTSLKVAKITNWPLSTTFTNPTPATGDEFGWAVAAVGSDRVLIGAIRDDTGAADAGAAYLFSTSGTLLTTFSNPTPAPGDFFGRSVAAVGSDRVLIGAEADDTGANNAGAAYLFSTSGTLLTTFNNPSPASGDYFGNSLAAVGNDRVLIGAYGDEIYWGSPADGAAYLFNTNGTLLTTFYNPTSASGDYFGGSVAAVGSDHVLIGAYGDDWNWVTTDAGAAYLFNTNGTLLTAFANPTPQWNDYFGTSVAAVGNNRVLIGASGDDTGASDAGAAYLFSTNGILLTTFTNPTPASGDYFGRSVVAVGNDRVLIGAYQDDTGAANAGAAYLFSTNGILLATFNNPTPASGDEFGWSVAAVGGDHVLIGAKFGDTGAANAGAANLFSLDSYTPGLTAEGVRPRSITTASLAMSAVGSDQLAAASVTTVKLAIGAVSSNHLAAGAVTTPALAVGAVTTAVLADDAVSADKMATVSNWFALTIANPTPQYNDGFGRSVAAVGNDKLLIGASSAEGAYLFSTNGTLLTTFNNPTLTPPYSDLFGWSVAAVGSDRVLIGALTDHTVGPSAGGAYLFSTSGTLLTTFTNPTPSINDYFGGSVAAVGSDRVLIGASGADHVAPAAGAAYLFSTNGTLLTTFNNPWAGNEDRFGFSVAAVGTDRVLIGAVKDYNYSSDLTNTGAAYLFSTNGTFLTHFENPSPANGDFFGISVAAVGTDRVLIGAAEDDTGAINAGAAYLFSTNGTLLTTFSNPTPSSGDYFGRSVAAVGADRVLIGGGSDYAGAWGVGGAAYLFSTNGLLLATFTKPTEGFDEFGWSVAAVGSDRVVIGARRDDIGATDAGAAYLFNFNNLEYYTPGLIADGVGARSIITSSLEDGAVTAAKISGVLFASQIPDLDASKITSGTLPNERLSSDVARRAGGNTFTGTQTITNGNVGIGTTSPAATLDVNGSIRVGGGGTVIQRIQSGQAQMASGSSTARTNLTITFPTAFANPPKILVSAANDPDWDVDDTFAVSARRVTTTNCVVNIMRVDLNGGWSQLVRINWQAWE